MSIDEAWKKWVEGERSMEQWQVRSALVGIDRDLAVASPQALVPLMTRCRAFPEIASTLAAFRSEGLGASRVDQFFASAPRDVRQAFDWLRRQAIPLHRS